MTEINIPQFRTPGDSGNFLLNHWRVIAALIVAVIVAVAAFSWYRHMQAQDKIKAENELGVIIVGKTGPERMQALEDFAKTAPASIKDAVNLEIVRTAVEQRDFAKSAQAFNALQQGTHAAADALDIVSFMLVRSGQLDNVAQALRPAQAYQFFSEMIAAQARTMGFRESFLLVAVVFLVAVLPAWFMRQRRL